MTIRWDVDVAQDFFYEIWEGPIEVSDVLNKIEEAVQDPRYHAGMRGLVDMRRSRLRSGLPLRFHRCCCRSRRRVMPRRCLPVPCHAPCDIARSPCRRRRAPGSAPEPSLLALLRPSRGSRTGWAETRPRTATHLPSLSANRGEDCTAGAEFEATPKKSRGRSTSPV